MSSEHPFSEHVFSEHVFSEVDSEYVYVFALEFSEHLFRLCFQSLSFVCPQIDLGRAAACSVESGAPSLASIIYN